MYNRFFPNNGLKAREIRLCTVENSVESVKNGGEYSPGDVILHYYKP